MTITRNRNVIVDIIVDQKEEYFPLTCHKIGIFRRRLRKERTIHGGNINHVCHGHVDFCPDSIGTKLGGKPGSKPGGKKPFKPYNKDKKTRLCKDRDGGRNEN